MAGFTTGLVTAFPNVAKNVGVSRIVKAERFDCPLGQPGFPIDGEANFRVKILERCLMALRSEVKGPTVF